ncbi:hypothetical protein SAMN05421678_11592 [Actinopolymorpha cephalotaxi]|uniref:Uncharacterized protein n=2 Tax=Actinopolymorpha cephalotaxi TaxID=504797 RepID=A0A1I2YZ59_9ACTN|nr:hypothetical protein SAMN05421678_11592 [Actinopolymorpha cephalotaxi]
MYMDLLRLLTTPRKLLGGATVVLSALAAVWVFGQNNGRLPAGLVLLLPVVILSVLAWKQRRAGRGWIYLFFAWALAFVAYGALFPGGLKLPG